MGSNHNFKETGVRKHSGSSWRNGGGKKYAGTPSWKKNRSPSLYECARRRMMDDIDRAVLVWQTLGLCGKICSFVLHPIESLVVVVLSRLSAESFTKELEIRKRRKEANHGA